MLAVEIPVDALDESVENRTQVMPQNERILHFLIIMNVSLITAALAVELAHWAPGPTARQHATYSWQSWVLSFLSVAALGWIARDADALGRLGKLHPAQGRTKATTIAGA